jgi:hypothetical protein
VSKAGERVVGRVVHSSWSVRVWLFKSRRPGLARAFGIAFSVLGLFLLAQGIISAWFSSHVFPPMIGLTFIPTVRWSNPGYWVAGGVLIVCGLGAVGGGVAIARGNRGGIRLAIVLCAVSLVTGIILICSSAPYSSLYLLWGGILDLLLGMTSLVLLALSWYTLDPLGLHW